MVHYDRGGITNTILIRGARQLLTLHGPKAARRGADLGELGIIADGALLIRDGVIAEVGPTRRVENLAEARKAVEINAAGRVVMPGFVDSHTHLLFPPPGWAPGSGGGAAEAAHVVRTSTGQRLEGRARAYLEAMARHGTTTVEVKSGCGPDERAEAKILRVLAALRRDPLDVIPTFLFCLPAAGDPQVEEAGAERVFTQLLPEIRRRRLACFADLAWDPDPAHQQIFHRYLETARGLGFVCKIHAGHPSTEAAVAMAVEHLVVSIDHLEHATPREAVQLADSETIATLLPCDSFSHDGPHAPARSLIDAGVAVALATNFNPHLTPSLNMQTVVALARLQMGMSAAEAISAGTINGAHALGCANRTGSLELGKSADLLILNLGDYRELGHHFGTNLVRMTMKRGEFIYKEGHVAPQPAEQLRPAW